MQYKPQIFMHSVFRKVLYLFIESAYKKRAGPYLPLCAYALFFMSSGFALPSTQSRVILTSLMLESDGISYITSVIRLSMMVRNPRAPVYSLIAVFAISLTAEGSKDNLTPSMPISF